MPGVNPEEKLLEEVAKLTSEVYKDLAKPATAEVGSVAGRTVKALLAPLRGFLWGWEKIEALIEEGIKKRLEKVSEDRRKTPDPEIAVPLMQALTYTAQNETLREMYLNLLANAMDADKERDVHPSFVDLIKQMNSLDAKVFERLAQTNGYQPVTNPKISEKGSMTYYIKATPQWFAGWSITGYSPFDISASLIRLNKFGLIDLLYGKVLDDDSYNPLFIHRFLEKILSQYKAGFPDKELFLNSTKSVLCVNDYGLQFEQACK